MNIAEVVFKGLYPYLVFFAVFGIMLRIYRREWTKTESVILTFFIIHEVVTIVLCTCFGGYLSRRYLLPAAPLLWGWAAYSILEIGRIKIIALLLWIGVAFLIWDSSRTSLEHNWKNSKIKELEITETLSPVIAADWNGSGFYDPGLWWDEYTSPALPAVLCEDYPLVGYRAGGSSVDPESPRRLHADYIIAEKDEIPEGYSVIWQGYAAGKEYTVAKFSNER